MSDKEAGADPLVSAIGEFRQELVGWIDSLLGAVRERHTRIAARPAEPAATLQGFPSRLEAGGEVLTTVEGNSPPRPESRLVASETSPKGDSRHRLDALARKLGERLRAPETSPAKGDRAEGPAPANDRSTPSA